MTKQYNTSPYYVMADADKVLCDGESITSLGGKVYSTNTSELDLWQEMTEDVAIASLKEATDEDYQKALEEMGVVFDDEI